MSAELNIVNTATNLEAIQQSAVVAGMDAVVASIDASKKELEDLFNLY